MMTALVAWLWQGMALACLLALSLRVLPLQAAATRCAVCCLALAGVTILPVMPWLMGFISGMASAGAGAAAVVPADVLSGASSVVLRLPEPAPWVLPGVLCLWAVVVLVGVVRLWRGWRLMRAVAGRARALEAVHRHQFERVTTSMGRRPPVVRVSDEITGACALGWPTPTVLLSTRLVETLDEGRLTHVVLHEMAHLDRRDEWTRLAQRVVAVVAGAHPAVRWISRRLDLEMEAACDQWVVSRTGDAVAYGHCLLDVAALSASSHDDLQLAPGASARMPMLRARIERLASGRHALGSASGAGAGCAAAAVLVTGLVMGGVAPELVVFEAPVERLVRAVTGDQEKALDAIVAAPSIDGLLRPDRVPRSGRAAAGRRLRPDAHADSGGIAGQGVQAAESSAEVTRGTQLPAVDSPEAELLTAARVVQPVWVVEAPQQTSVSPVSGDPAAIVTATSTLARQTATGATRAAQATASAFSRAGRAVAQRF